MKILDVIQGSDQWLKLRESHFCASDAPAMMGVSKYKSRDELLQEKATGIVPEVDDRKQALFDQGHAAEAAVREIMELRIGDDLYPVVVEEGDLLASLDAQTLNGALIFEIKLWNQGLVDQVLSGELDPMYYWQLEHQLLVCSNAKRVKFIVSDGTEENLEQMEYWRVPGRAEELRAGWDQFEADLVDYQPIVVEPKPEGVSIQKLPTLVVDVTGKVTSSNLVLYEESAANFVAKINTDLQDDQDFADAKGMVKFCQQVEDELKLAKAQALSQMATVDEVFSVIDRVQEDFRKKRLKLDALVKTREKAIKAEIVGEGKTALWKHVADMPYKQQILEAIDDDFPGAAKNKRTLKSLRESVSDELARCKIEVTRLSVIVSSNEAVLTDLSQQQRMLFQDANRLILKEAEDFALLVKSRVDVFEAAEKEKERVKEEERKQKLQVRIDAIHGAVAFVVTADLETAERALARLEEMNPEDFEERDEEVEELLVTTLDAVIKLVEDKRIAEAERIRVLAEETKVEVEEVTHYSFGTLAEKEVEEEPLAADDDFLADFARIHIYGDAIQALVAESPHMDTEDGVTKILGILGKLELAIQEART